jgi:acetyl esterase/lipase
MGNERDRLTGATKMNHAVSIRLRLEHLETRITPRVDILNLNYGGDGLPAHNLDLHLPDDYLTGQPLPTIIWIHGGGWQSGSKTNWQTAAPFVERGYAVASVEYRLTNVAIFPAQIHDIKGATRWLRANAAAYNLDTDRFASWGSSAGGHLAALLGTSGGVARLEGSVGGNLNQSSRVRAVVDYFGPTDLWQMWQVPGYEYFGEAGSAPSKLIGGALKFNPKKAAFASPATYVAADDPPTLMAHGTLFDNNGDGIPDGDGVVPWQQTEILDLALQAVNVDTEVYYFPGVGHGGSVFTSATMMDNIEAFLESHLPPSPSPVPPFGYRDPVRQVVSLFAAGMFRAPRSPHTECEEYTPLRTLQLFDFRGDSRGGRRVVEVDGSQLNGPSAGDEEFHHIVRRTDAADADDWDLDLLVDLPDHP